MCQQETPYICWVSLIIHLEKGKKQWIQWHEDGMVWSGGIDLLLTCTFAEIKRLNPVDSKNYKKVSEEESQHKIYVPNH